MTTLRAADGRYALRMERRLKHPPAKVWRAITEPAELTHWFPFDVELEAGLAVDAKIRFVDRSGAGGGDTDGVVLEVDPPRVFAFSWAGDELRWELAPDGDGCLLVMTHTFADGPGAASFAAGWHVCVDALEVLLAGGRYGQPEGWTRRMAELHEEYVARLGLDPGTVEDGRVRFDRQLTRPIDTVWALLVGEKVPAVGDPPPAGFVTPGVQAGAVTEVEPPRLLEYVPRHGGRVRWELTDGTGHGARLILTHTGAIDPTAAEAAWRPHVARLAADVAATTG